jgi:hypothetical protein
VPNPNRFQEDGLNRPRIYGELILYFNEDVDLEVISGIIGVEASFGRKKSESPASAIPAPFGLWGYRTAEYSDYDCAKVIEDLHAFIASREEKILAVINKFQCAGTQLTLVITGTNDRTFPGTVLPTEFLADAIRLHADIDIDIY